MRELKNKPQEGRPCVYDTEAVGQSGRVKTSPHSSQLIPLGWVLSIFVTIPHLSWSSLFAIPEKQQNQRTASLPLNTKHKDTKRRLNRNQYFI